MPELPEVETVRRTLGERVLGRQVVGVRVSRPGVVYALNEGGRGPSRRIGKNRRRPAGEVTLRRALLEGERLARADRHGKQLALIGGGGLGVCVHLGMSGSLCVVGPSPATPSGEPGGPGGVKADHVHVVWQLDDGAEVWFRDPRRFGGLWTFESEAQLRQTRWAKLGHDALAITPGRLHAGLSRTQRDLKTALLDQQLVAGLGNIYVDELLYTTRLHPQKIAATVTKAQSGRLVRAMRRILGNAIAAGGSTLRDYVDATNQAGGYQTRFKAYGRAGQPCGRCGRAMESLIVAGRSTSACPACQRGATPIG
ncbi:MAG: bifunctional DNA-formamidopyrimidine glycosylase/DNA-(apurinic or apyrimidinic site) lyase [Planctomycetota bacterium]